MSKTKIENKYSYSEDKYNVQSHILYTLRSPVFARWGTSSQKDEYKRHKV